MRTGRTVVVHSVALALLIAPPMRAQTASALADTLRRMTRARGDLPWSSGHPVVWADFQGKPKEHGKTAAETSSGVTYTMLCRGEEMRAAVLATFSPARSWVRTDVPKSRASDRILRHERTHFNISELFARQLRRELATAKEICPSRSKDADRIFDRLKDEFDDVQERYDRETSHGTLLKPQAAWNLLIAARLDSTSRWAAR